MKHIFLITVIFVIASGFAFGPANDEQAVRQTLDQLATAIKAKDTDALNRIWPDDYTFISREGTMYDKAGQLARLKSRPDVTSFAFENVRVRMYGNTAVATKTVKMTYVTGESFTDLATHVLIKKGGRWQVVAAQGTLAAK
jgi:ketosteroid isomerase-like protein